MHGAAKFNVQFQMLQINLITDPLLLCIHFLSQNQNLGCIYWNKPIHTAGEVSLFGHYMVAANFFRVPPTPSQAVFPWDVAKKCHSAGTPKSSL
jgi:hypothetical protein